MTSRFKSLFWTWLPVLIWLVVIVIESTSFMSSDNTGSILETVLKAIIGPIDPRKFHVIHFFVRKAGHFIGYGILGLFFFRAIKRTVSEFQPSLATSPRRRLLPWAFEAIVCTSAVAALDEWHQSFLPSRTGAFHDVVIDALGAIFLLAIAISYYSRSLRTTQKESA